jgi:hypothetical protein
MTAKNWTCSKRSKEVRSAALQTVLRLGDVLIALPLQGDGSVPSMAAPPRAGFDRARRIR